MDDKCSINSSKDDPKPTPPQQQPDESTAAINGTTDSSTNDELTAEQMQQPQHQHQQQNNNQQQNSIDGLSMVNNQHGGSSDSLNSTTDTVIPTTDETSDSNREPTAPALPPRTKTTTATINTTTNTNAVNEKQQLIHMRDMFIDSSEVAQPPPQKQLTVDDCSRMSIRSVLLPAQTSIQPQLQNKVRMAPANNATATATTAAPASSSSSAQPAGQARVVMFCQPNSHPFQTRTIVLEPNQEVKVGRSITRNRVSDNNAIFDCKVLSRNHAQIWTSEGKFYIRDTASSNGTFVNDHRLSLTATSSKPYEVRTGDVVQFGVDVLENAYKEKHGCIVTMLRFCTGNDDTDDLTDPTAVGRYMEGKPRDANGSGGSTANGSNGGSSQSLSSAELFRLNAFIQEAMQREQLLETKLMSLQKIVELTRKNSASVWHSMIEEDHLLSRIDILENKLQYFQSNVSDDQLRTEVMKLQDDKSVYQTSAKEALRKVYQERNEAVMKLSTIERALCSSEDECALLRNQLLKTQQSFKEVTVALTQLEERTVLTEAHERQMVEVQQQREYQMSELCDRLHRKTEEAHGLDMRLRILTAECEDLRSRIETYAKMGERKERRRQRRDGDAAGADGKETGQEADDDDEDEEEDEGDLEGDEDDEDDVMPEGRSGSSMVNKWLSRLSADAAMADSMDGSAEKDDGGKKNKSHKNKQLVVRLEGIDENLRTLDKLLTTLKHNRETTDAPSQTVQNDDNQNNAAPSGQPAVANSNEAELLRSIGAQLRQVYADLLLNIAHSGESGAKELAKVQAQLQQCRMENTQLVDQQAHTEAQILHLEFDCTKERNVNVELQYQCRQLEQQLAEAEAIQSVVEAIDEAEDDDDSDTAASALATTSANVLATTAVQTDPCIVVENHTAPSVPNGDVHPAVVELANGTQHAAAAASHADDFRLSDFGDDIALLTDPAVRREEELIAFKEECARLKAHARLVEQQLAEAEKRLTVDGGSGTGVMQPVWLYAALVAVVIGYIIFAPYW